MWPPDDPEALWSWSCDRYARAGVADACLDLQDRLGAEVNLLLLACWLAEQGRWLAPGPAARAGNAAIAWQIAVVRPLRETRRMLKRLQAEAPEPRRSALDRLRRSVAADELEAERLEQMELQRLVADCPADRRPVTTLARINLAGLISRETLAAPQLRAMIAGIFAARTISAD
jgi:uncharacterized protein (TIGR02444 family)